MVTLSLLLFLVRHLLFLVHVSITIVIFHVFLNSNYIASDISRMFMLVLLLQLPSPPIPTIFSYRCTYSRCVNALNDANFESLSSYFHYIEAPPVFFCTLPLRSRDSGAFSIHSINDHLHWLLYSSRQFTHSRLEKFEHNEHE